MILPANFYQKPTLRLAADLLGTLLVHNTTEGRTVGRIVETEAYLYDDPACHAARGKTKRTEVMFGPPGIAYIYFIYGMYDCLNVVSGEPECGEAVLIRALEPISGVELMRRRRRVEHDKDLCNGPAKLVMAMGIRRSQNGVSLRTGSLTIHSAHSFRQLTPPPSEAEIQATRRIGISKGQELEYRFLIRDNPFVSKGKLSGEVAIGARPKPVR